jgi:hypothetical protein
MCQQPRHSAVGPPGWFALACVGSWPSPGSSRRIYAVPIDEGSGWSTAMDRDAAAAPLRTRSGEDPRVGRLPQQRADRGRRIAADPGRVPMEPPLHVPMRCVNIAGGRPHPAVLSVHHGRSVRWRDANCGDFVLEQRRELAEWLAARGVPDIRDEMERSGRDSGREPNPRRGRGSRPCPNLSWRIRARMPQCTGMMMPTRQIHEQPQWSVPAVVRSRHRSRPRRAHRQLHHLRVLEGIGTGERKRWPPRPRRGQIPGRRWVLASSSRSQVRARTASPVTCPTRDRPSISVRRCPLLSVAIVTRLGTRSLATRCLER